MWMLTLSPKTVLRIQVFNVWYVVDSARHAPVLLISRKNLTLCTNVPKPRSGIWKRMLDDLNR
jgi:hypothetical protein